MSEIKNISASFACYASGAPEARLTSDGQLQVWPTGIAGGLGGLYISVADWDVLDATVRAAIAEHQAVTA